MYERAQVVGGLVLISDRDWELVGGLPRHVFVDEHVSNGHAGDLSASLLTCYCGPDGLGI